MLDAMRFAGCNRLYQVTNIRSPFMRVIFAVWMLCLLCAPGHAAPVLLDHPSNPLHGDVQFFVDPTNTMTLEDIRSDAVDQQFQPLDAAPAEYAGLSVWLKFSVQQLSDIPKEWWLELRPANIEYLTLYQPLADGSVITSVTGRKSPINTRVVNYRYPFFKVDLVDDKAQTLYIKVQSELYGIRHVVMWEPAAFVGGASGAIFLWGLYLGIFSLLFVASLWFERAVGDGVYHAFGLYALSCLLMTLSSTGLTVQYQRWIPLPPGAVPFVAWSILFGVFCCVNFFFRFVGMHAIKPRFTRVYLASLKVFGVASALLLLLPVPELAYFVRWVMAIVIIFIVAPVTVVTLWRPALNSSSEVRHAFFLTGLLLAASVIFQYALHRGYFPTLGSGDYVTSATSLMFALVIYYSISKRYQAMRVAKEILQRDIIEMMRHSEQELDKQVQEKKRELLEAMTTVSRALSQERAAYEEQKHFIERVSTELHAPLDIIDATTKNMVQQACEISPKMHMRLEKIQLSTNRLSSLLKDYLASNRLNILSRVVNRRILSLPDLLNDAIVAARPLAERHIFSVDTKEMPQFVYADPDLLRLVLRTLVDNAVKYTPAGTAITLHADTTAHGWHIDVADNGVGIPPEEKLFVFDRYFRGRMAAKRTGTGLGLPLARRLVEMQGGRLTLLDGLGSGCVFRIYLPHPDSACRVGELPAA